MSFPSNSGNLSSNLWQENIIQSGEERCLSTKEKGMKKRKEREQEYSTPHIFKTLFYIIAMP